MPGVWAGLSAPWLNLLDRREALRQRHGESLFSLSLSKIIRGSAYRDVVHSSPQMER
jgi:hypothetical protein